ncbi:MAG: hypothetical protein ACK5VX_17205 [Akkermansiaceae bacterium]
MSEIYLQLAQRFVADELRGGENERLLASALALGGDGFGMSAGKCGGGTPQPRFIRLVVEIDCLPKVRAFKRA